jgi:hypothetical protein
MSKTAFQAHTDAARLRAADGLLLVLPLLLLLSRSERCGALADA